MRQHKLLYASSYDRGLDTLLLMWGDIRKEVPDAELHICYGWDLFLKVASNNPERMAWYENVCELMKQDGITHYGRLPKDKLERLRKECGIWAYPTYFTEINCITALECQHDGCVPVVLNFDTPDGKTALDETVVGGIKVNKIEDFKTELVGLMKDQKAWKELQTIGRNATNDYDWSKIAEKWTTEFAKPISMPKVTIITPTIRKGFWNVMAHNIAQQTYKNIEWVVVDDHPNDRSFEMKKACDRHHVEGKYVRGGRTDKYFFGLSTANNIGWKNSSGELIVFLQDFVLMPAQGIECLVDIYRHHPDCLIAPTDVYHYPSIKPDVEKEDWFNGETDIIGDFIWKNARNQNKGMRYTESPFEFEMNYGAIPKRVIDDLGGWWEFMNDGLGYDNTEIAYRALKAGYHIIVDDTNQAFCIDHWEALKDKQEELGTDRVHRLNDPRYIWMLEMMKQGRLPLKRNAELDSKIKLNYEMPPELSKDDASTWIVTHTDQIIKSWEDIL